MVHTVARYFQPHARPVARADRFGHATVREVRDRRRAAYPFDQHRPRAISEVVELDHPGPDVDGCADIDCEPGFHEHSGVGIDDRLR